MLPSEREEQPPEGHSPEAHTKDRSGGLKVVEGSDALERMVMNMPKRYYIAYGSNLNIPQMRIRCPKASILGTTNLEGWELVFRGSRTGSYLTIEEKEGGRVPAVVWEVTDSDEAALDRYEGFPKFYYKRDIPLKYRGIHSGKARTVKGFAYVMHEDRPIGIPDAFYMRICLEGYAAFQFDDRVLMDAYARAREVCAYEG